MPSVPAVAPATSALLFSLSLWLGVTALLPKLSILFHNVISSAELG